MSEKPKSSSGRGKRRLRGQGDGWEERGGYMQAKIQKLQQQFSSELPQNLDETVGQSSKDSRIFEGVAIHVNGYTKPGSDELKRLMQRHGGCYIHYYTKSQVTHIIASNLPTSKMGRLTDHKVVKPNWITDSVEAGRLLPYQDYLLCKPQWQDQQGIKGALSKSASSTSSILSDSSVSSVPPSPCDPQSSRVTAQDNSSLTAVKLTSMSHLTKEEGQTDIAQSLPENGEGIAEYENTGMSSGTRISVADSIHQGPKSGPTSKAQQSVPPGYKAADATFVSDYYTNSRLHHISSWGAECKAYVNSLQSRTKDRASFPGRERLRNSLEAEEMEGEAKLSLVSRTSGKPGRCIMHVDMDCFFVSVGLKNRPHLKGKT